MKPCKQAGNLRVLSKSCGKDYPQGRLKQCAQFCDSDLYEWVAGALMRDTRPLGEMEGGRPVKMLLINYPRAVLPGWVRSP